MIKSGHCRNTESSSTLCKKVGIFGGSFDPPHLGHIAFARSAKEHFDLDQVWFVPVFVSPFKTGEPPALPEHRLEMLKLLLNNNPDFKVLDFEILKKRPCYTVDSLQFLTVTNPTVTFFMLIGQDALEHFLDWKKPEEIVRKVKLIVAPRKCPWDLTFLQDNPLVYQAALEGRLEVPLVSISSTEIRMRIKDGSSLKNLITNDIENYIALHGLYQ